MLEVNPKAGYFIGVDLGKKNITTAIIDFEGKIVARLKNTRKPDADAEETIGMIVKYIRNLVEDSKIDHNRIKGVGLAVPGLIDFNTGTLIEAPNLKGWDNTPLKAILEKKLDYPVHVDRNARTMMGY